MSDCGDKSCCDLGPRDLERRLNELVQRLGNYSESMWKYTRSLELRIKELEGLVTEGCEILGDPAAQEKDPEATTYRSLIRVAFHPTIARYIESASFGSYLDAEVPPSVLGRPDKGQDEWQEYYASVLTRALRV